MLRSIRGFGRTYPQGGDVQRLLGSVEVGDRVRDPRNGRWRLVTRVDEREGQVFLADGGVMGVAECTEIRLPSECEALPDPELGDG